MSTATRPLVLSVTEAGLLLGFGRSTAYELVHSGELESLRLRRRVVVPAAAVAQQLGVTVAELWEALSEHQAAMESDAAVDTDLVIPDFPRVLRDALARRAAEDDETIEDYAFGVLRRIALREMGQADQPASTGFKVG